ncbi:TPA: hypothetical protein DDZ49_04515 [Candidatus Wolfebacteria bacterium]|nr:hypothetical protein [Candidatus Wolfebacteria bacterium]HAS95051.1 hypothetical protein [Candidatus Wolfebacteria bacterium]HBD17823.1 hypothetical protein [Candidatus Wolfebacteria bacterium]HBN87393.1 hypothetical protein [Candidatus Wolfebacteria bacterium]HBT75222.1 hypothetical protein [Candidatus Wolfebacteria bacterium]
MIVFGLVSLLISATAVYNRAIQRQIVLTREHATALGLFIRARSAGLTAPRGTSGELVCGYGIHIDAASRTFTFFKDLGISPADCSSADFSYTDATEKIDQKILGDSVSVTDSGVSDIVYTPPYGKVYTDGIEASDSVSVIITSLDTGSAKGIRANAFGQITEYLLPTP